MTNQPKVPEAIISRNNNTMTIRGPHILPRGTQEILELWLGNQYFWFDSKKDPKLTEKFKELIVLANKLDK